MHSVARPHPVRPRVRFTAPWRLHYYRDEFGNFGDDLNPWLWSRLLPDLLDDNATPAFIGIGTVLNENLPDGPKLIVGSGTGYGTPARLDESFAVHFVRGPRTAAALGLPATLAITDPAHLITQFMRPVARGKGTIFLPHHVSAFKADWRRVARAAGMRYVDPGAPFLSVLESIRTARLVVTSAMHGAILADAFRVPWVRVKDYAHINEFKWGDWTDSVGVPLVSHTLPALHDSSEATVRRTLVRVGRAWRRRGYPYLPSPLPTTALVSERDAFDRVVAMLSSINTLAVGSISDDSILADRVDQLVDKVEQLKRRLMPMPLG